MTHSVFDMGSFSRYIKAIKERFRFGHIFKWGNRVFIQLSDKFLGKTGPKRKEGCYG